MAKKRERGGKDVETRTYHEPVLRMAGIGLVALGLHAGVGYGAHELSKHVRHEHPVRLKRFLLQKRMMAELLERIKAMREDDEDEHIEIDVENFEKLEEIVEALPEPDNEPEATELDTSYPDVAYSNRGDEGEMGDPHAQESGNRYGVKGPEDNPDPHIARQAALRDAVEFGMIGLLNAGVGGDLDAPTALEGRDDSLGNDPLSARGNMWGDSIGESFGAGGLGLKGVGEGGGGRGEGIGLGSVGTIGHGAGSGSGQGFGSGHGRLGRSHRARPSLSASAKEEGKAPKPKTKARARIRSVSARGLNDAAVKRVLRKKRSAFRRCYRSALASDPTLAGAVRLRFRVNASGSVVIGTRSEAVVSSVSDEVAECALNAMSGLTFPQPKSDSATVTFKLSLSQK